MTNTVISYPIPPYNNPPIDPQFYQPSRFVISNISLGCTTTITTTEDTNYVIGQLIRLIIPSSYGCRQLNESQGYVISLPLSNQVEVNIDSSKNVDNFISSSETTQAQVLAIGDINSGVINSSGRVSNSTYILGSFINISPN